MVLSVLNRPDRVFFRPNVFVLAFIYVVNERIKYQKVHSIYGILHVDIHDFDLQ